MILVIGQSPHEGHFRARIATLEPKIRRACDFISGLVHHDAAALAAADRVFAYTQRSSPAVK